MLQSRGRIEAFLGLVGRSWYTSVSIVLVLCFVALASLWVNLVPVFESPDEAAQFDYVYSLATAGTLLRATDGPLGIDPRVAVLGNAAGLQRIAFRSFETVDESYGSPQYDASIRAGVRAFGDYSPRNAGAVRPLLISVYPFFAYALYALLISPFRSDVASAFYACREASVALSALGMFGWSRILLRLRLSRLHALSLLAIFALFPLTAFVASSVQPDGIAFLLTALTLLTTLRIRDGRANSMNGIAYATLLAALVGTKLQFFVAVFVATIIPVIIAYGGKNVSRAAKLVTFGSIAVLSGAMYVGSAWLLYSPTNASYFVGKRTVSSVLTQDIKSHDWLALLDGSRAGINDLFLTGTSARSYWGEFGWLDTPIQILNVTFSAFLVRMESFGTGCVIVILGISTCLMLRRITRVGSIRSGSLAIRLGSNDPVYTAYVIFAALLLALWVSSGNLFGAQGRNWYSFEIVAFMCLTKYAPRLAPHRYRRYLTIAGIAALAFYSVVGSASALTTIEDRYYNANRPEPPVDVRGYAIISNPPGVQIDGTSPHKTEPSTLVPLKINRAINPNVQLYGWAFDPVVKAPCKAVYAAIDGRLRNASSYGFGRPEVAISIAADLQNSGFMDRLDLTRLSPGSHKISLYCVSPVGKTLYTTAVPLRFQIDR